MSLAAAMIAAASAQAATCRLTDLGTLAGEAQSVPNAMNAKGHVTGSAESHVFLYADGALRDLGTPPAAH